jgi:PAB-dependent poly(A)-specific ribonuclease subunit 2
MHFALHMQVDRGCIFVGHGLKTDFRVVNIFVPPEQVGDTLELWNLPGQRKLSLRFLGGCLLGTNIQGETHDSIEDAKAALQLYNKFLALKAKAGEVSITEVLKKLYGYGYSHDWKYDSQDPFCLDES